MITSRIGYDEIQAAVDAGIFIVFAAGRLNDEPGMAWMAAHLDGRAAEVAHSDNTSARAAQAVGAITHLRRHARHQGFEPV